MAAVVDRAVVAVDTQGVGRGPGTPLELSKLVADFATALQRVDRRQPQAPPSRTGTVYRAGIGPHTEAATIRLVVDELVEIDPVYSAHARDLPYPGTRGQRCDWCLGAPGNWDWAIEAKLLRLLGDNGKPNDKMISHLLSPYPKQHSALTDCATLATSSVGMHKAILVIAYDYDDFPIDPLVDIFESLAHQRVALGERVTADFEGLVHPVHTRGSVLARSVGAAS